MSDKPYNLTLIEAKDVGHLQELRDLLAAEFQYRVQGSGLYIGHKAVLVQSIQHGLRGGKNAFTYAQRRRLRSLGYKVDKKYFQRKYGYICS
jgi:hypothetical protein